MRLSQFNIVKTFVLFQCYVSQCRCICSCHRPSELNFYLLYVYTLYNMFYLKICYEKAFLSDISFHIDPGITASVAVERESNSGECFCICGIQTVLSVNWRVQVRQLSQSNTKLLSSVTCL